MEPCTRDCVSRGKPSFRIIIAGGVAKERFLTNRCVVEDGRVVQKRRRADCRVGVCGVAESLPPTPVRDSRIANARRPLTAKVVRKAAFKYNGVANFGDFWQHSLPTLVCSIQNSEQHAHL